MQPGGFTPGDPGSEPASVDHTPGGIVPTSPQNITRPISELLGRHLGYGFAGSGVSTAIGNYTETDADLSFSDGLLGLLDWSRTYNSLNSASGVLGPGWTTSFGASLAATAPHGLLHHAAATVTFHDVDGRILPFTPTPDGGFTSPQDLDATLARNADGSFTLTFNSGEVWAFDTDGRLTGKSLEGQEVTISYDAGGRLLEAEHAPSGTVVMFTYDASGRLTQAVASDGRTVGYGYAGDGTLASVTLPGSGVVQYATTGGVITQVTDPDGNLVLVNVYGDDGRVSRQNFPGGGTATFGYDAGTLVSTVASTPSGAQASFQANQQGRLVSVTDAGGNTATFGYDANGRLSQATTPGGTQFAQTYDGNGNVLTSSFGGATVSWTYDDQNRVTSFTDAAGDASTYAYAGTSAIPSRFTAPNGGVTEFTTANGLVTARTDPDGNTTTFGYDPAGNLTSVTSPLGGVTLLSYDEAGNRTQMTSPSGRTSTWTYDGAGRVLTVTNPAGETTSYRYSPGGLLVEVTDAAGASISYAYDAAGNQTQVTDPVGRTATFGYDADGNLVTSTRPGGGVTRATYDALGNQVSITDPVDAVYQFGYDADGQTVTEQTPSGTTGYGYDARGNLVTLTEPTGGVFRYAYDLADRQVTATTPEGATWSTAYDTLGSQATTTNPLGATTTTAYTTAGLLASQTDPLGRRTSYTRDADGRVTTVTNADGGVMTYVYDPDGRVTAVTTPAGLTTRFTYDPAGRVIAVTDPRGWIQRYQYNARGQKTAIISASGTVWRFAYDAAGQMTEAIDPLGAVTQHIYDADGNLTAVTDPKGAVARFGYDANGRETSSTDALGRTTTREYDPSGNLITITDPSGHSQHRAYDADRRLTQCSADGAITITYGYDSSGRLTEMTDATGTTRYAYDAAGHLITLTGPDGGAVTMGYDAAGQRTAMLYPDGLQVSYAYNLTGALTGLADSRAGNAAYAVDPEGRLLTEQLPGRLARRYHYDRGLLRRFETVRDGRPVAEVSFEHDPDGRIIIQRQGGVLREFRYNAGGQLASTARDGDQVHYTYDAAGNRVRMRHGQAETRYRYDAADQLIALEEGRRRVEFRYDSSGRLVEETEGDRRRAIDYDGFGRPALITRTRGGSSARIDATFNGVSLLSALTVTATDERREQERSTLVRYLWSAGRIPQILTQRAQPETDDAEHDHAARLNADFTYGHGRTFASWEHGAATFYRDAFRSVIRTQETAVWVQAETYGTFGEPEDEQRGQAPELPKFGYRGELALGPMSYLRARAYDSSLGRFLVPDPVVLLRGLSYVGNPYAYANNDPVNFTDPLGLYVAPPPGLITAAAVNQVAAIRTATTGGCHGCPNLGNIIAKHKKCFWGVACLDTRGHLNAGLLTMRQNAIEIEWGIGQKERTAQAAAINELNRRRGGRLSPNVDWEVGLRIAGGFSIDILADSLKDPSSETRLFEVKLYEGPATSNRVKGQLQRYIDTIADPPPRGYGVQLTPSTELAGWVRFYSVGTGRGRVWVWGPSDPENPGHVYFAPESDMSAKTRKLVYLELWTQAVSALARLRTSLPTPEPPDEEPDEPPAIGSRTGAGDPPYGGSGDGYGFGDGGDGAGVPVGVGRGQSPFPG
jgi:RHS repeat-associated protein